jgi:pimeloyl-ACP methyl ester carboxylesterase
MPDLARAFCRTPLGHVHYVEAGPRGAPAVVLLHQTPRSVDEFAEVIPLLAGRLRVIAVDAPGYGCSDHPTTQPTIADYAGVVLDVLDATGLGGALVAGHHTGAVVAVELAAARPGRVRGVALSGPVYLDASGREALAAHFAQWHVRADGSHLTEKWAKFSNWTAGPALVHRLLVDLLRAGETSEFGHDAVAAYRMEERLPLVRCPGALIYGTRDPFSSPASAGPFREVLRPLRETIVEAGVFLPNEAPRAFADAILALAE